MEACASLTETKTGISQALQKRWSEADAARWYAECPWLIGSNYIPATAVNQLEMWQEGTFDPERIALELGWAADLGMNVMRVFLHDLLWNDDAERFCSRVNKFLEIASGHGIRTMFVLFDSCWHPHPESGIQPSPIAGIHNSGWVQSPGAARLCDSSGADCLRQYVSGIIRRFADDTRVLAWDLWNEPDNENSGSYAALEFHEKLEFVGLLLPKVFEWARSANPSQPLTSGIWAGDWSSPDKLTRIQRTQIDESDIISFHNYASPEEFEQRVRWLEQYRRPLLCTEYMARSVGSTFESILPKARQHKVAAINWGFVQGKSQTHLPWDSWQSPYISSAPPVWFHDILHTDGTPYSNHEVRMIRKLTGSNLKAFAAKASV